MNDYGRGGAVLGAATSLPATSAAAFLLSGRANEIVVVAMLLVTSLALLLNTAMIVRYFSNSKK